MSRDDASYIEHLEAKVAELEAQIRKLEDEIKRLRKEKGLSSAREGLTFNQRTGIWSDESQHYCPKCLDKDKRNPLTTEKYGWRCGVCGDYTSNPDSPPPVIRRGGTWGRGRV